VRAVAEHKAGDHTGECNADRRADTGDETLAQRRAGKNGNKKAESHEVENSADIPGEVENVLIAPQ
ncbi:hypothetical protein, partial [Mesorhizobium sp. M7A.F.Ca.US.006.04.2.1]|uniref:hypothetical protein n=1 Tax=Mesorhizobium sp. M7A.F.Ca.US.006.04.2.1 TaxID=2496696 RepID=UPI0013E2F2E3